MSDILDKCVKGSILKTIVENVVKNYGQDKHNEILSNISEEARKTMSGLIISVGWYPIIYYEEYLDQLNKILFNGDKEKALMRAKQTGVEKFSKGIYAFFTKFGGPKQNLKRIVQAFEAINKGYTLSRADIKDNKANIRYEGMAKEFKNYEIAILGFNMGGIEASGGKNVKGRIIKSCTQGDDGVMEEEITWE